MQCYIFDAEYTIFAVQDSSIKNVIFDLGGVILDLSINKTLESFSNLSGLSFKEIERIFIKAPEFELFEKGLLSDQQFRAFVRNVYKTEAADHEIDQSWNAMLGGIPSGKIELLTNLKANYQIFLLSNTNSIHLDYINQSIVPGLGLKNLNDLFHAAYYSHQLKMRKPETDIFEHVLKENNLKAEETLFLDDNALNIEGAQKVGIKAVYITTADQIFHEFR